MNQILGERFHFRWGVAVQKDPLFAILANQRPKKLDSLPGSESKWSRLYENLEIGGKFFLFFLSLL